MGSMRVARRAGSAHATTATTASSAGDGREHERIGGADAEQLALEALAQRERADRAEHEAGADQQQPLAQHQLEDRAARCCRARCGCRSPWRRCVTRYASTP